MYGPAHGAGYPDPELSDGVVRLRRWSERDLECIAQAATDPSIPASTSVPAVHTEEAAPAFIRRQWRYVGNGEGAIASDWALGPAGMARVEAWVEPGNETSQRLLSCAGFTREGVLRSFLGFGAARADVVVFARIAEDPQRPHEVPAG
jgi:hypothetical protein